jgi:tetratricopeptide (TPR) repeat protein
MHNHITTSYLNTLRKAGTLLLLLIFFTPLFAQQSATYDESIVLADKNYKEKRYLDAKAYYQMALKYKSGDAYAKEQIATIVEKLKAGQDKEDAYFDMVDLADVFYEEGALEKALAQYQKALTLIPDDEYALRKIADIQRVLTEERDRINAYNKSMEEGNALMAKNDYTQAIEAFKNALILFPERSLAAEKIETAKQLQTEKETKLVTYNDEMELAGRYLLVKDYATALEHYEVAQGLFPDDEVVRKKIETIRPQAENQQRYNQQVEAADELYISKDFLTAKEKYAEAGKLWPENTYPADMITKIEEQLALQRKDLDKNYNRSLHKADSLLALQIYTDAKAEYNLALILKPNESYPKTKLKEINAYFAEQQKAFENNYAQMLAEADKLFNDKEYTRAKEKYEQASESKPDDTYPKEKLAAIDSIFAEKAAQEKKDASYNLLIAEADKLFANGHYDLAIKKYQEAKMLKTAEAYPEGKITEIQQLLANAEKQKEIDKAFGLQMVLGVRLFKEGKFDASKNAFENAIEIKPYDAQPKIQIARIDSIVEVRILQAQADKKSAALIARGDSLQEIKEYDLAILAFEEALQVKPKDPVAAQKLSTVKIVKRNYEKAVARQKAYDESITKGDRYFEEENYELAKTEYEKAIELKNNETHPKQRLVEIDGLLEKLAAERQKRFDDAIVKGDNHFEQENYQEAVLQYKIAESIKPAESYPKQRIAECNSFLAERLREIKAQYSIAIADADKLYATKIYDKAIKAYKNASNIKPDEDYPRDQIAKITNLIEVNAITDVVTEKTVIHSETTERFTFEPLPINVRKSNYILIKAKNLGEKSFKIIFTYGSKNGKNGGFVVQVPEGSEYNDFIIRVGNQYKWFSDDNDWLSIYPENGDIEISMLRISKSD